MKMGFLHSFVRPQMAAFSVRCIFRWAPRPDLKRKHLYEERITLWQANDIDEAIALAEDEARAYASDPGDEYLDFCQAYAVAEEVGVSGVEVFSLLRESDMDPDEYIDAFFDEGGEHERAAV